MAICRTGLTGLPDGYSVLLTLAAFLLNSLTVGVSFSFGLYFVNFVEVFGETSARTAWVGSINYAAMCASGLGASYLSEVIGIRKTALIGALLTSTGFLVASFASNLLIVIVSLGIITGVGFGLVYMMGTVAVAMHFDDKHRPLALIVAQAGFNAGAVANSLLGEFLIETYGWRGAMLVTSALTLNLLVGGSVLRQAPKQKVDKAKKMNKMSLWGEWRFYCLHLFCLFLYLGHISFHSHISAYALHLGFSLPQSLRLISIFSVGGFFTQSFLSLMVNLRWMNVNLFLAAVAAIPAAGHFVAAVCHSYVALCISSLLHSFVYCAIGPAFVQSVILQLGKNSFSFAYACLLVSMATGALTGPPVAGAVFDLTSNYHMSFFLTGSCLAIASVCALPMSILMSRQHGPPKDIPPSEFRRLTSTTSSSSEACI